MDSTAVAKMPAGRDLDCIVAELVMGWKPLPGPSVHMSAAFKKNYWREFEYYRLTPDYCMLPGLEREVKSYSTSIIDGWEVVDRMLEKGYTMSLYSKGALVNDEMGIYADDGWRAIFTQWGPPYLQTGFAGGVATPALAICLAAVSAFTPIPHA